MQAVFFDLDGTLLDTLPDIAHSLNAVLASFGYPVCTPAQVRTYVGDGAKKLVSRAIPQGADNVDEVYEAFRQNYGASAHGRTVPYAGMAELLKTLKSRGTKLAVITNKPQEAAQTSIQKFYPALFDYVGGDSGNFPCKPDPSLTRYVALTLRVPLKECVFVGDGEADVRTAQNAGVHGVAALWGYRTREQLTQAGATQFASSPAELAKILANFRKIN